VDFFRQTQTIPNLVIIGLALPVSDGFEVIKEIRSINSFSEMPIIVFTSSSDDNDRGKALALGATLFEMKPVDLDEYQKKVQSSIQFVTDRFPIANF
jgi:DNA-binding response OmpR family regulator